MLAGNERIIVALDVPTAELALGFVDQLSSRVGAFKVGMELYYAEGPAMVQEIHQRGGRVFLDLKLHDIPHTVEGAALSLSAQSVWMTNVHASGGAAMMEAARRGLPDTILLAVTVLTSMDQEQFSAHLGIPGSVKDTVQRWAQSTQLAGLDGVVCSPQEIEAVRQVAGTDFLIVTPGIRPEWAAPGDQRRITTPGEAVRKGADYLVIGRPITGAVNPRDAVERITEEILKVEAMYHG